MRYFLIYHRTTMHGSCIDSPSFEQLIDAQRMGEKLVEQKFIEHYSILHGEREPKTDAQFGKLWIAALKETLGDVYIDMISYPDYQSMRQELDAVVDAIQVETFEGVLVG